MRFLNLLGYPAIALAFASHAYGHGQSWEPRLTFLLAAFGVVPLAQLVGHSTEHLAARVGPTWGGLLNATFGNAAELIIAVIGLTKGLNEVVKATLTGSILGNLLLVSGAAMVVGGWGRQEQRFNRRAAEANAGLLTIAVAAMLLPAIFHFTVERLHDREAAVHEFQVSAATSVVLLSIYALGLLFTLRTHRHVFSSVPHAAEAPEHGWSVGKSVLFLLLASAGIGFVAELLVGSAEALAQGFGWSPIFVGVILLAIVGNAAEHSTALQLAHADDMETAMAITYQSSLQVALFVTPVLVLLSAALVAYGVGHATYLDMVFTPLEVVAVILTVFTVVVLGMDGRTNWFEGALLLGLYTILGIVFFCVPQSPGGR